MPLELQKAGCGMEEQEKECCHDCDSSKLNVSVQVGRPRPNFAARCWPNGQPMKFGGEGVPVCAADAIDPGEGRKSFPSGMTSCVQLVFILVPERSDPLCAARHGDSQGTHARSCVCAVWNK